MAINVSPVSRELTEHGATFNRGAHRLEIQRERIRYMRRGGMIAVYGKGDTWERPRAVRTMIGRKTVQGDVSAYVALVNQRREEKARRARRLHDERLARAACLQMENDAADAVRTMVPDDAPISA